jgi:hypothetical protein
MADDTKQKGQGLSNVLNSIGGIVYGLKKTPSTNTSQPQYIQPNAPTPIILNNPKSDNTVLYMVAGVFGLIILIFVVVVVIKSMKKK